MKTSSFWSKTKVYLKNPWIIAGLIIVVLVIGFLIRRGSTSGAAEVLTVKQGTVREEVSVTGKVKPAQAVDLSLERSGRIVKINKNVGDHVKRGEIIIQVDNADLVAGLAQAQAALRFQQSKLAELKAGTRPEQLDITKTKLANAERDVLNARTSVVSALQNAYSVADDAVRNKIDVFFSNPRSSNPQVLFVSLVTPETSLESGRVEVEDRLRHIKSVLETITPTSDISNAVNAIELDLGEVKLFIDNVSLSVNSLQAGTYLTQATVTEWKANVSSARTSINTAITSLISSGDKYTAAQSAYKLASNQLDLDKSGVVSQEIDAQEAQVAQAEANVSSAYAQLAKSYVKAPIEGIVTKQEASVGETLSAGVIAASVMSDATFGIEANIPEADIAKVKTGQIAEVTLDAYSSNVVFEARVVSVDPAETIVDGVPTYKTTFQFERVDERIKSGMTANVTIQGETRENVLYVPQRALKTRNGQKYATVQINETQKDVLVKTGLRGADGSIEILEGLSMGDSIVVSQK